MPYPAGLPVVLDPDVRRLDGGRVLLGGDPGRLVRLRTGDELDRLCDGGSEPPLLRLARTLVDSGLAHPRPALSPVRGACVVVPVRDRADELDRCLAALGADLPVLVVDDGSDDPVAVARVAAAHGAELLRQDLSTGPGGARNAGIAATTAELVALVDSDCQAPPGWLQELLGHFDDPRVGAVAPRIVASAIIGSGAPGRSLLARYAAVRGPLDLGAREARVRPGGRVPYVPTAALVVRRAALGTGPAFDAALRYGEDVDLVWRLHDAGWSVRYDPRTVVRHAEPDRWEAWLARRHRYGTSAAPLSARHPGRLTPLVLPTWPTAAWLLLLARRPVPALAAALVPALALGRVLHRSGLPAPDVARTAAAMTVQGVVGTASGIGGAGAVVSLPLLLAALVPRLSRAGALAALLAPPLLDAHHLRPAVDPLRWTVLRLVDDLAYASGVWRGCWSSRTVAPLRPRRTRPR